MLSENKIWMSQIIIKIFKSSLPKMGESIPSLDRDPSFHPGTMIWSCKLLTVLKGFVRLIYRNPAPPINFVPEKKKYS